jgi:hypothetical protein
VNIIKKVEIIAILSVGRSCCFAQIWAARQRRPTDFPTRAQERFSRRASIVPFYEKQMDKYRPSGN